MCVSVSLPPVPSVLSCVGATEGSRGCCNVVLWLSSVLPWRCEPPLVVMATSQTLAFFLLASFQFMACYSWKTLIPPPLLFNSFIHL